MGAVPVAIDLHQEQNEMDLVIVFLPTVGASA